MLQASNCVNIPFSRSTIAKTRHVHGDSRASSGYEASTSGSSLHGNFNCKNSAILICTNILSSQHKKGASFRHISLCTCSKRGTYPTQVTHASMAHGGDGIGRLQNFNTSEAMGPESSSFVEIQKHPVAAMVKGFMSPQRHVADSLFNQIEGTQNVNNLRKLVNLTQGLFEPQHYRAVLSRLISLVQEQGPLNAIDRQHVQMTLEMTTEGLEQWVEQLGPHQVVGMICLLAKMKYFDGPLLTRMMKISKRNVVRHQPWHCSGLLWALGRYRCDYGLQVDSELVDLLLSHLSSQIGFSQCDHTVLVRAMHGCALLNHTPSISWSQGCLQHLLHKMDDLEAQDLSNLLWSLAVLRIGVETAWLEQALKRIEVKIRGFNSGTMFSSVLWSLAVMKHAPSASWMEHFLIQVQRMLNRCDAQNLSVMAWALALLRYRPHNVWLERFLKASASRLERLSTEAATKPHRPTSAIQRWLMPNESPKEVPRRSAFLPQCIANLMWALAKLQLRPRGLVLKRLCSAALSALPSFTPRDMSHLVWALQRMRFLPEPEWMLEAQLAIQAKISQFDEPCLIIMLAAFGGYRYAARNRASKGHTSLILVDSSMVDMLLKRLEQVTVFKTSAVMSQRSCCTLLVALVKLNAPVSNELHRYLLENISLYIEDLPLSQLCLTSWGLSLLGKASGNFMQLRQGSELQILARIQNLTRPHLASSACNSADLLQLLVSFSEASVSPDQEWLHLLEVCAVQHLRTGLLAPTAVSGILGAYKKLGTYHPRTLILTLQGIMTEIKERRLHNLDHELSSRHLIGRRKVSLSSTQRHVVELSQTANSSVLADARF